VFSKQKFLCNMHEGKYHYINIVETIWWLKEKYKQTK
jgi:hypothetical protein